MGNGKGHPPLDQGGRAGCDEQKNCHVRYWNDEQCTCQEEVQSSLPLRETEVTRKHSP